MTTPESLSTKKSSQSLLLQQAFGQFISLSERKIAFILNNKTYDLYQELVKVIDFEFTSNMELLGSMAKYDLKCIIDSLMAWRKSKNELQERDSNYESKVLLFNYILVMILINILKNLSEDTFPANIGVKIEEMVFGQLTHTDPDVIVKKINRHSNMESFAALAGVLSELRFATVSSRFLVEINKHSAIRESKGELLIRCMRYLKLKIYPLEKLEETVQFLKVCGESFLESHSLKLKHAFAMTFLDLLEPIAAVASAEVNLPTWMKTIELIFPKAQKMIGKPRHFQTAMPLITTLLCVSKRDFFLKNWLGFCDIFVQRFKDRDKPGRQLALSSVTRLVWVYLFRCVDSVMTNAIRKMDSLVKIMFPFGRRTVNPSDLDLEMYIRVVYYICNKFPDFSAETVFPLLLGYSNQQPALATSSLLTPDEYSQHFPNHSPIYPSNLQSSSSLSLISNASISESVPLERYAIGIGAFHYFIVDVLIFLSPLVSSVSNISSSRLQISTSTVIVESKYALSIPQFPRFRDTSKFDICEIQPPDLAFSLPTIITFPFLQKLNCTTKETLEKFNEVMGVVGSVLDTYFRKLPILELLNTTTNASMSPTSANPTYVSSTITSFGSLASNRSSLAEQSLSSLSLIDFRSNPNSIDRTFMNELWKIWIDAIPIASPSSMNPRTIISLITLAVLSGTPSLYDSALLCLERISRIESINQSDFWTLNVTNWREFVIENFLEFAYRCLIENMTDLLGSQWKNFEMSIISSVHRLLDLWLIDVKSSSNQNVDNMIDQLEGCSLIFLCSVNSEIRLSAIEILKKINEVDSAVPTTEKDSISINKEDNSGLNRYISSLKRPLKEYDTLVPHKSRILSIFKEVSRDLIKRHYVDPSAASRTSYASKEDELREREQRKVLFSDPNALMKIAGSSSIKDAKIWVRCFPDLTKAFYDYGYVQPLVLAFRQLMNGVHILSPTIAQSQSSDSTSKGSSSGTTKWASEKSDKRISNELLEQWSLYCIFGVSISGIVTVKDLRLLINGPAPSELAVETLFTSLLDFLGAERTFIRQVAIRALCGIPSCNYRIFLDLLEPYMHSCIAIMKTGNYANNRRTNNPIASLKRSERQRQDLVQILSYVADFVDYEEFRSESTFLSKMLLFIKQTARFLSMSEVQNEWDHQLLRFYFCGLVGRIYSHLVRAVYDAGGRIALEDLISFELRLGLFRLLETWCGYGELSNLTRNREAQLMNQVLGQVRDITERASLTTLMEDQRMSLEIASLKAMCALSFGPLTHAMIRANTFDLPNIIMWIKSIFSAPDRKIHPIAHLALDRILSSNSEDIDLWNLVINECYIEPQNNASIGFFLVISDLLSQNKPNPLSLEKICILTLYKIGHSEWTVRKAAACLFTRLDQHFSGLDSASRPTYNIPHILDDFDSHLPDNDDSNIHFVSQDVGELTPDSHLISRPTPAVYKGAQRGISAKWADQKKELSLSIMMECFIRIDLIDKRWNEAKDMLIYLAPWVSSTNLENLEMKFIEENGKTYDSFKPPLSPEANLCLTVLFCLTVKYAHDFVSEIEGLWLMLFEYQETYTHRISMEIISEYLIQVALQKKNPKAILCGKTVLIYLAQSNAFEILMQRITPENMIPYNGLETSFIPNMKMIDSVLLDTSDEQDFSRAQIALMFISDIILQIAPSAIILHLSTILHVCLVHIDHFSSNIVDDCVALLNGTIQALVLDLKEPIISSKGKSIIKYEDISPPNFHELESVARIKSLVETLTSVFSGLKPNFKNEWAEISFKWGISCPVRHIACRSLQIYRCLSSNINKHDTAKLIFRISTILGDKIPNVQGYAMECLDTLIYMLNFANYMGNFVDMWWAGVACLYSPHSWEYAKGIEILRIFPDRLPFDSQKVLDMLSSSKPISIDSAPILERLLQGLYTNDLGTKTLHVFNILSPLPVSVEFLGDVSKRLLYGILANVTLMMKSFDFPEEYNSVLQVSVRLSELSHSLEYDQLSDLLLSFSKRKFRSKEDFIFQLWSIIHDIYPSEIKSIVSIILKLTSRKDEVEIVLQVLLGLVRVLGPSIFSSLSKSTNFWSPLIDLIQTNASSPGLIAVLDIALSKSTTSETDIKMLFGQSKSFKSYQKSPSVDARQVRHNLQNVSRNFNSHINSISARNERLKRELEAVTHALEEELEVNPPEEESESIDVEIESDEKLKELELESDFLEKKLEIIDLEQQSNGKLKMEFDWESDKSLDEDLNETSKSDNSLEEELDESNDSLEQELIN